MTPVEIAGRVTFWGWLMSSATFYIYATTLMAGDRTDLATALSWSGLLTLIQLPFSLMASLVVGTIIGMGVHVARACCRRTRPGAGSIPPSMA